MCDFFIKIMEVVVFLGLYLSGWFKFLCFIGIHNYIDLSLIFFILN